MATLHKLYNPSLLSVFSKTSFWQHALECSFIWLCVFECMLCGHIHACMPTCMSVQRSGTNFGCHFSESTQFFDIRSLTETWASLIRLGLLPSKSQGSACLWLFSVRIASIVCHRACLFKSVLDSVSGIWQMFYWMNAFPFLNGSFIFLKTGEYMPSYILFLMT